MSTTALFDRYPGFFRPLVSKYRAQIAACLGALFERLYGVQADAVHAVSRQFVLETFREALENEPEMRQGALDDDPNSRFQSTREQALWFLNLLLETGWCERQVDEVSLTVTYSLTRDGRRFAEALAGPAAGHVDGRSHHRNTRQVRNALRSFRTGGEVYDLLDAWEYSARILSDFTDVIEELDERRRALVSEVQEARDAGQASSDFFDFMEQRFRPDIAVRLSADNVEKYRTDILQELEAIRQSDTAFKEAAEHRLRELMPERIQAGESLLWQFLDDIENRLKNAAEVLLPGLRRALQNFTRRADIVIRQINYLSSRRHRDVSTLLQQVARQSPEEQSRRLENAADRMAALRVGLPDPGDLMLAQRKTRESVRYGLDEARPDPAAEKQAWIEQAEAQAFVFNDQALRERLEKHQVGTDEEPADWPVATAPDFLALAHRIAAGNLDGWTVEPTDCTVSDEWFAQRDRFVLRRTTTPRKITREDA